MFTLGFACTTVRLKGCAGTMFPYSMCETYTLADSTSDSYAEDGQSTDIPDFKRPSIPRPSIVTRFCGSRHRCTTGEVGISPFRRNSEKYKTYKPLDLSSCTVANISLYTSCSLRNLSFLSWVPRVPPGQASLKVFSHPVTS